MRIGRRLGLLAWAVGGSLALANAAMAQPLPAQPAPPPQASQPGAPAPPPQPAQGANPQQGGAPNVPYPPASTTPMEVPNDLSRVSPSGLTGDQVGARAATTSYAGQAQDETLRGAAARVDQAWAAFLPRLTGTARYTRLSDFTPPAFGGNGSLVGTPAAAGALNPAPTIALPPFTFPLVLNNYLLQASIVVPISDYFLRLNQNYSAATHSQEAAHFDALSSRAKSAADGRVAFYTWLRARGAVIVAVQALNDQRTHLALARNQFAVGQASRADTLRAETNVAAAELQVVRSQNLADLTETQVRLAIHAKEDERLVPGESIEASLPPVQGNLPQLTTEAMSARLELKSIDANAAAAREQAKVSRAGSYPVISAFADGIYANPNPRRFPQSEEWFPTWDVGAQAVWSPNDILIARGSSADLESRAAALEAQKGTIRDSIQLEVVQAWQGVREADVSVDSAHRELASAEEAYRVTRELFNNGRATSTTLTDSETELTRARLDLLNAAVDARTARVRLDHALGRDTRMAGGAP